jgi:hypothetical protein
MSCIPRPWFAYLCQVYPGGTKEIVILLMGEPSKLLNYTTGKFIHIDEIGSRIIKKVEMPKDVMDKLLMAYY